MGVSNEKRVTINVCNANEEREGVQLSLASMSVAKFISFGLAMFFSICTMVSKLFLCYKGYHLAFCHLVFRVSRVRIN